MTTLDDAPMLDTDLQGQLDAALNEVEILTESLVDAQMRADDQGWARLGTGNDTEFDRAALRDIAKVCRVSAVANPLIGRGLNLRIAYVWGQGVSIAARQEDGDEQDVNAVVQAFLDDPSNKASFTSSQAREELERALGTDGNVFLALFTDPLTGRVQVRSIPTSEIDDIICNPEDRDDPWFYKRTYSTTEVVQQGQGITSVTRTRTVSKTTFYPAVGFWPKRRPKDIDGHEVRWDAPVLHASVNRLDGWKFGIGDAFIAVNWARGYKEFLEDWAKLMRSLSRFAWRATAKGRNAAQVRSKFTSASTDAGQAVTVGPDQSFEAIPKTGATIDAESGRPLGAMVAAGMGVPLTMLLADPGVTGARATAETLDQPMHLMIGLRQELWKSATQRVLDYVIDQAIKAPRGMLQGTRTVDQVTGREVMRLTGDQDRSLDITFPDLTKTPVDLLVKAITEADGTQKLPPLLVARLLMEALGVDDVDELLEELTDGDGNFLDPYDVLAARSQQDAVAAGDVPRD